MIKNLSVKKLLVVLIVSLPLTGMTQLRFNCCAYGPGELLLSVWVICSLFILRSERVNPFENDTARVISWFWLLSIIVMAIGAYFGHSLYPWDYLSKPINHYLFHSPIHDAIAYVSLMLLTITLASCKYTRQELLTAFVAVAIISAVFMYGLLMMKYFGISTGSFRLVGSNVARFAGLANNPNQAALLIIFVPFLITAYIENNGARLTSAQKFGLALVLAVSWLIGLETRSTAFKVSILVWFAIILFFWLRLIVRKNKLLNPAIKILFLSILLAAGLNNIHKPFVEIEQERTRKFVKIIDEPNVKQEKNSKTHILRPSWFAYMKGRFQSESIRLIETIIEKSEPRFVLYKNGFRALSHSPIVGLGPGPYSGDDGPFEKREVHNSFVDWIVNTGIIGGIAMLALFFWSACRLLSAHCYSLFCGFMGMCLFAQFHHVVRHPIVWIFLILALKIADLKSMNLET